MVDKVIVSHAAALTAKYGKQGFDLLRSAIDELIAADSARDLRTELIFIDDASAMRKLGGSPSADAKDERGAKDAVDAIATAISPDYIALLDGPDVIPHIVLDVDFDDFHDTTVDSDLPYASSGKYSRKVKDYLEVTRVVARIPNVPGATSPQNIIQLLKLATRAKPRPASEYQAYFGLGAEVFRRSTATSIGATFQADGTTDFSPPAGPPGTDARFANLSHFINCHGLPMKPEFYGQKGEEDLSVAMSSAQVAAKVVEGTVVAAECCYGAQLYDPKLAGGADPICIAYLVKGALGFLGSTNTSYGWDEFNTPNGRPTRADLMTRFFFERILAGASLGRSLAQARQQFISTEPMHDPVNLKTLAQFLVFGDPATTPCIAPPERSAGQGIVDLDTHEDATAQRKVRRVRLASMGHAISEGKAVPSGPGDLPEKVKERVWAIAKERGYAEAKEAVYSIGGSAIVDAAMKARGVDEHVMVISSKSDAKAPRMAVRHLIAHIVGDGIVRLEETVSR